MPNLALIPDAETRIDPLVGVVDGFPDTEHSLETLVGGEPLEDSREITDHVVARQERLTLTGWVSDWSGGNRPGDAWTEIRRLQKAGTPLRVVTEWGTYAEMVIRRAQANYEGRGQRMRLELHEILRVGVADTELAEGTTDGPAAQRAGNFARGRSRFG